MFSFVKKREKRSDGSKETRMTDDPVFGRMKYIYTWWSLEFTDITMFRKTYHVRCFAASNEKKEPPDDIQRRAFERFLAEKEMIQQDAEKMLTEAFPADGERQIGDIINITGVHISRDGKCGIAAEIKEEYLDDTDLDELGITPDHSFGVLVFPERDIIRSSDIFEDMFS